MRFCERCGKVIDEFDYDRDKRKCPNCSEPWSEDDMTGLMYLKLSDEEKDAYDEQLINRIKSSPRFSEHNFKMCGDPVERGTFWAGFRPQKWKELRGHALSEETYKKRMSARTMNLPFKPFPPISEEEAQQLARDAVEGRIRFGAFMQELNASNKNIPKCPICQSTDLSKLSDLKKAVDVGLFGIYGAGDLGKTYKCNNCGSKF